VDWSEKMEEEKEKIQQSLIYCDKNLVKNLRDSNSKTLIKLKELLQKNNCDISIYCGLGDPFLKSRSYFKRSDESREIILFANKLKTKNEIEETLIHELIHAHDDCVKKLNLNKLNDIACSEIRAAYHAECSQEEEEEEKRICVTYVALKSIKMQPNMNEEKGKLVIEKMMKKCFNKEI
jgi:hypothetical protein